MSIEILETQLNTSGKKRIGLDINLTSNNYPYKMF